jgi:hypothetical protein
MNRLKLPLLVLSTILLLTPPSDACHGFRSRCRGQQTWSTTAPQIQYCFYAHLPGQPKELFGPYTLDEAIKKRTVLYEGGYILDPYLIEC